MSEPERYKLRLRLNALGFYALTVHEGLDVYVTYDRRYFEDKALDFLRNLWYALKGSKSKERR